MAWGWGTILILNLPALMVKYSHVIPNPNWMLLYVVIVATFWKSDAGV
jgi:hypothetical protein